MQLDMDIARQIMLRLEENEEFMNFEPIPIEGVSPEVVSYHVKMLAEAGYIEADDVSTFGGWDWRAKSLTFAGHEFLDSARDEDNWKEAKQTILQKGGSWTFAIVQQLLLKIVERKVLGS